MQAHVMFNMSKNSFSGLLQQSHVTPILMQIQSFFPIYSFISSSFLNRTETFVSVPNKTKKTLKFNTRNSV
ncbi:hypothetical protein L1987_35353 [Smallanthus sonchifolius]|uniref:Uncharacterized protein n=1 Tax=Smallanthus sonchifolius TaxID=185202 RepID=A0ACB9HX42_9ASTR|nr:hypothetical protein L1987_35353 [Smallanthus sonchifolius]